MRNKLLSLLLLLGLMVISTLFQTGCGNTKSDPKEEIKELSMLSGGKTFAVPTGTIADQFVLDRFPDAEIKYFNTVLDCAMAVKNGKVDAAAYDEPVLKNIAAKNHGVHVLPEMLIEDKYGFAVNLQNAELKTAIDTVVSELRANGGYDDMVKRWFPEQGAPAAMPEIPLTGDKGILRFGTSAVTEPFSFMDGTHQIVGFDVELATRVAQKLGKDLEIVNMDFGALIPSLAAGKVDLIAAGLSITEERAKQVLFSESYYLGGIAALVQTGT